jgi:hypothetical protein
MPTTVYVGNHGFFPHTVGFFFFLFLFVVCLLFSCTTFFLGFSYYLAASLPHRRARLTRNC